MPVGALKQGGDFGTNRWKPFSMPGPETIPAYWYPQRAGVRFADERFREKLAEFDPKLSVTWNPIIERWQVWVQSERVKSSLCPGWLMLFIVNGPDGEYAPLDERVFARLYSCSAQKFGSMKEYFNRIEAEMAREREKHEEWARQDAVDRAMPLWDHSRISVAMRGKSSGSKFSTYHA